MTLKRGARIIVTLMRHVAATGHGKRHHPARDVKLATSIVHGKPGKNSFALAKIHHHVLPAGRYLLRITADGKPHIAVVHGQATLMASAGDQCNPGVGGRPWGS